MQAANGRRYDVWVLLGTCLGYTLFFAYIFASFSLNKSLHNKYVNRRVALGIYQTKWNLYTSPPFDSIYRLYTLNGGKAEQYDVRPFSTRFLFGLKRDSKIITEEMTFIMRDTSFMNAATAYSVSIPIDADINKYLNPDTLKYVPVDSKNVRYLKGKYLITSEQPLTWEQVRSGAVKAKMIRVLPVNITGRNE